MYPAELTYTVDHEWARRDGDTVRVGITSYAQSALGDVVYVTLPEPGTEVGAGEPFGEVESTKSVAEVYAPVSGTVLARNEALEARPELLNTDPYGDGWLVEIRASGEAVETLDAQAYARLVDAS